MDILKIFSLLEKEDGESHHINIQGTVDDPLFQANQIGKILELKNIHDTIKDFSDDEKGLFISDTLGGKQETNFLTELGLYRLLGRSRKPIAATFQKWMVKTIKEIRITGMYQLKSENEVDRKIIEYNCSLKNHRIFLNVFDDKNVVYIFKLFSLEKDNFVIKIGHTDNINERIQNISSSYHTNQPILLDVFEIYNNCNCEKQIRKNEFIQKFRYSTNVKKNGEISRETYLVNTEQYEEFIKIIIDIKKSYFLTESQSLKMKIELEEKRTETIRLQCEYGIKQKELEIKQRELAIRQKELDLEIKKIELENNKFTVIEHKSEKYDDEENNCDDKESDCDTDDDEEEINILDRFTIKTRKNGAYVPVVYQYTPNDLTCWIKKWDCPMDVERNMNDISPARLRAAAKNNTIYKGFRWIFVNRNLEPPEEIDPTIHTRHKSPEVHFIAMIDIKKTKIMAVYKNQKEAVEARNMKCNSFTRAIKEQSVSSGHYWNYFDNCSTEMKEEYLAHSKLPEKYVPNNGKQVQQIDPKTNKVIKIYSSNREICKLFQMSCTKLKDVIKNNEIHQGFKWNAVLAPISLK